MLALAARLAGYRDVTAFGQFADLLDQDQRQALGCFFRPSRQHYTTPNTTTFHGILATLPPDTLDATVAAWAQQQGQQQAPQPLCGQGSASTHDFFAQPPVCMDGKDVRGASNQTDSGRRMLFAAGYLHYPAKTRIDPSKGPNLPTTECAWCLRTPSASRTLGARGPSHSAARLNR